MAGTMETRMPRGIRHWRIAVWGAAAFLLLLPAVAMQFTREVDWDAADFTVIAVMLLAACAAFEIAARVARSNAYLLAALGAIGAGFVLVWINLAVGIIGSENDPANLLFGGVLLTAIVGAAVARLQPRSMAIAMYATAAVQGSIGIYAAIGGHVEAVVLCVFFAGVWIASGLLFAHAARQQGAAS